MENEILYSHKKDDFSSADASIEEAVIIILDDMEDLERSNTKEVTVYSGVKVPQRFINYFSASNLIDDMQNLAYDESGEWAEDYLDGVTEEQKKELELLVCEWANKHKIAPTWFMIEDVEPVVFKIPDGFDD